MGCWNSDASPDAETGAATSGPENVLVIRSGPGQDKNARIPASLGNKTWNVPAWTNSVTTSQYTWWNFIFLNLWQQVLVPANFYFLVMSILQLIPEISDSGGVPTYLMPLAFVFVVTMVKDGWEDIKRHRSDREENNRETQLLTETGQWTTTTWAALKPGDIVKVKVDEIFPADLVMLTCSDDIGCCYVETVQLDGETNMKTKTAIPELHSRFVADERALSSHTLQITQGPPSAKLYNYNGGLKVYPPNYDFTRVNETLRSSLSRKPSIFGSPGTVNPGVQTAPPPETASSTAIIRPRSLTPGGVVEAVEQQYMAGLGQFLWRGAQLTNTAWITGMVVYPGHYSRICQNTRSRVVKYSGLMKSYNYNAFSLFVLQLFFCILAGLLYAIDVRNNQQYAWYLQPEDTSELKGGAQGFLIAFAVSFGRWVLLMSYFIPITLLVQIEVCRWFHGFYIGADRHSYSKVTNTFPNVSTLSIMEDLGVITHVFSDKTGTLTQNIMQLKSFAVGSQVFGFDDPVETKARAPPKPPMKPVAEDQETDDEPDDSQAEGNRYVDFDAKKVKEHLLSESEDSVLRQKARDFLLVLSVCHSVLPKSSVKVEKVWEPGSPSSSVEICSSVRSSPGRLFSSRASLLGRDSVTGLKEQRPDPRTIPEGPVAATTPTGVEDSPWDSTIITPKAEPPRTSETRAVRSDSWRKEAYNETPPLQVVPQDSTTAQPPAHTLQERHYHAAEMQSLVDHNPAIPRIPSASSMSADTRAREITNTLLLSARLNASESNASLRDEACLEPEPRSLSPPSSPITAAPNPVSYSSSSLSSTEPPATTRPSRLAPQTQGTVDATQLIPTLENPHCFADPPPPAKLGSEDGQFWPKSSNRSSLNNSHNERPRYEQHLPRASLQLPPPPPMHQTPLRLRQARLGAPTTSPPMVVGGGQSSGQRARRLHPHPQFLQRDTLWPIEEASRVIRYEEWHAAAAPDKTAKVKMGVVRWKRTPDAQFDASSPDELALVAGAKHMGVEFLRRPDLNSLEVAILDSQTEQLYLTPSELSWIRSKRRELTESVPASSNGELLACLRYEILEVLDFDNFRKRMSVIIRDRDGGIKLLCKGADSSMLPVLAGGQERERKECEDCLADFAREGLRTLVLGVRLLSPDEFERFRLKLDVLRGSGVDDVEKYGEVYSSIECELTLVGCTGIDDKLQDQVPQTIEALKDAGIRVWVLTGDKVETAISIGHSCNLLTDTTYNAIIDGSTLQEVQKQMYEYMAFVVGAQLAKESFEQIILQQAQMQSSAKLMGTSANSATVTVLENGMGPMQRSQTETSEDEMPPRSGCCRGCLTNVKACCPGASGQGRSRRRLGSTSNTATMNLNDFVSVVKQNAHHTKVVAPVDGRNQPKQLSAQEIEQLINVYIQQFGDQEEKRSAASKLNPVKLMQSSAKRAHAPNTASPSKREENIETINQVVSQGQSPRQKNGDGNGDTERVEHYTNVAITITGDALQHALSSDEAKRYFFGLAHLCSTVIACRVTPKQKAEVVRQSARCTPAPSFTSLGIGDGANDVGMILTANVGVGILGKEGSQAARSADIAIGEFKILRNLLFAHGHDITRRHSIMMYQTLYKNIIFAMTCWFAGLFSGFSAADNFDAYQKQTYNLLLTPWPICAVAVFDRALPYGILYQCASLYPMAMRPDGTRYFGTRWFTAWFLYGIIVAGILTLFSWATLSVGATDDKSGRTAFDWNSFGQTIFTLVVMCATIPSIPFTHTIFWFTPLGFLICIGSCYLLWAFLSGMSWSGLEGSMSILHQNANYNLLMMAALTASMSILFIWWRYTVLFRPTPDTVIRERIKKGVFDVVVAPRRRGELAVVVPRTHQRQRHLGFAHAPSETRFSLRRKSMNSFMGGSQSSASIQPPPRAGLALDLIEEED